ncbi:hypothetical protein NLJ89_g8278 [Agrocybe chaxingu]|uniref:HIT domain-containing protein n=1 Tax=Agrocybe chaxingu TaxID=84603 RepID=A0A9W8JV71_9AGAR|nr:hypothetical protein NLJ89_g8278 [Agrocybe chaxingu]
MSTEHFEDACLFCRIIKGKPSVSLRRAILETEYSFSFLDVNPTSEGHSLVIPKYHAKTLLDLPDEYLRDIAPLLKKVAKAAGTEEFNVIQNNGEGAFQTVPHVHFHVIPKPGPKEGLVIDLEINWPAKLTEKEVLAKTLEKMKARIDAEV